MSENTENLFTRWLCSGGLSDEHIAFVLECLKDICLQCFDARASDCHCWDDE